MGLRIIGRPIGVAVKLSAIAKICKYKWLNEGHHFISMTMEVHDTFRRDMDRFIRECARLFHDRRLKNHLSLSFCVQFFKQCVNIALQCALASTIEIKIALMGDVYSRPPITIKSHNLHASDIRGAMGEIASYHERD
jgi:hypothetical protein